MADTEKALAWSRHMARASAERIAASRRATASRPDPPPSDPVRLVGTDPSAVTDPGGLRDTPCEP